MSFNKHYTNFRRAEKYSQEEAEQPGSFLSNIDPYQLSPQGSFVNPSQKRAGGKSTFVNTATEVPVTTPFKDYNIPTSNTKMLVTLLNISIITQQPMLVYGDAGIGKSGVIQQAIKASTPPNRTFIKWKDIVERIDEFLAGPDVKKYYVMFDMRASEYLPEDIRGIPDIRSKSKSLKYKPPGWVAWCTHPDAAGVMFFDELNRGITPTLNALLQVTLDRVIVEKPVAAGVAMLAAANLGGEFNGANELDPALRNRFSLGAFVPDPESWIEYAQLNGVHPDVIDFVKVNATGKQKSGGFNAFYQVPNGPQDQAFVTPRSLVMFSTAYKALHDMYDKSVERGEKPDANFYLKATETKASQYCGNPWGTAFATFVRNMALFDLDDLAYKTETQSIDDLAKDPKTGAISISTTNSYISFVGRALLYNLRPDVRYTPEGIKNLMSISRILPKFRSEGIGQIRSTLKVAHPGGLLQGKDIAEGGDFMSKFVVEEEKRYNGLRSAAAQLKMSNEAQIDAFIRGMYANAELNEEEMEKALDTFKNFMSRNKGDGVKSFEDLNVVIPGVLPADACSSINDTISNSLSGAASIAKGRRRAATKFSTFG
jgi:hypothetical protein